MALSSPTRFHTWPSVASAADSCSYSRRVGLAAQGLQPVGMAEHVAASRSSSSSSPGLSRGLAELGEVEVDQLEAVGAFAVVQLGAGQARARRRSARTHARFDRRRVAPRGPPMRRAAAGAQRDRAAPGARAGRAARRARSTSVRSAAALASWPSMKARLRPWAVTSRRTTISRPSAVSKLRLDGGDVFAGAHEVARRRDRRAAGRRRRRAWTCRRRFRR